MPLERFIAPRVEVELAFCWAKLLKGPGVTLDRRAGRDRIRCPAIEIIDARIEQFDRETKAPMRKVFDTISDFAANAGIIVGPGRAGQRIDLRWGRDSQQEWRRRGNWPGRWRAPAIRPSAWRGSPTRSRPMASSLNAGDVVLAGLFTRPVNAARGDSFEADYGPPRQFQFQIRLDPFQLRTRMILTSNPFKEARKAGKPQIGFWPGAGEPYATEIWQRAAGFDWC